MKLSPISSAWALSLRRRAALRAAAGANPENCIKSFSGAGPFAGTLRPGGPRAARPIAAFTMIEIAISLAVIGFALVAIIGVMPIGMNAQRDNREETIINQDAAVLVSAIRNGARGYDDLTNHIYALTNYVQTYEVTPAATNALNSDTLGYVYDDSAINGVQMAPVFGISNGYRIVGLLSRPKYEWFAGGFRSNYIIANVRALSGLAAEKSPQDNVDVMSGAFSYRLICENQASPCYDSGSNTNGDPFVKQLTNNLRDLRLTFRWPLRAQGGASDRGRHSFRTTVGGHLISTNDIGHPLYFFEPRAFELAK